MKKKLAPLRTIMFDLRAQESSSYISFLKLQNIDFDVFLPTKGLNLQRELVWSLIQKQEIIYSILLGKHIPHLSFLNIIDPSDPKKEIFQVIDGKQRLSSIFDFIDNKFAINLEGEEWFYNELPEEYQRAIYKSHLRYYLVYDQHDKPISDEFKINWFKFINYAGTPQEQEHMNKLSI
jgi:hypothetical protein